MKRPAETVSGVLGLLLAVLTVTLSWSAEVAALAIACLAALPAVVTTLVDAGWLPRKGPFKD